MSAPANIAQGQLMPVREPALGGNFLIKNPFITIVPPSATETLSEKTMSTVMDQLRQYGQTACPNMEGGLRDLAQALEAMAEGGLPRRHHLSSLDPGIGKTTMMQHFIHHLLRSPQHDGVSVMVCVSRIDEVKRMVSALSDVIDHVEVLIGKDNEDVKALTPTEPTQARVLITTQQMIEKRCDGRRFHEASAFHYKGQPRQVRIWDEAFLPGQEVSLSTDDLASLLGPLRNHCSDLADGIENLRTQLKGTPSGERLHVPSLQELGSGYGGGHAAKTALMSVANDASARDAVKQSAQDLIAVAGQQLGVRQTSKGIKLLLDYRDTIPQDLAPMVILDASGRCRHTYRLMEQERGDLVRLKEVRKGYSNLEVGIWPCGGGKSAFARDQDQVRIRGIAQTIMARPSEDWLIIHHKGQIAKDIQAGLESHLPSAVMDSVHFLHWGDHHGTNAFVHIHNVILAGTLFLPEHTYEGRARLSAGLCNEDDVSQAQLKETKQGENAHAILQGLCRASVRGQDATGRCKPCRAYIIASPGSGIPKLLPELFPGSHVNEWQPIPSKLKGKLKAAVDHLDTFFAKHPDAVLTYNALAAAIGVQRKNFRRTIRHDARFQEAMQERCLEEVEVGTWGQKGVRAYVSPFPIEEDDKVYTDAADWDF